MFKTHAAFAVLVARAVWTATPTDQASTHKHTGIDTAKRQKQRLQALVRVLHLRTTWYEVLNSPHDMGLPACINEHVIPGYCVHTVQALVFNERGVRVPHLSAARLYLRQKYPNIVRNPRAGNFPEERFSIFPRGKVITSSVAAPFPYHNRAQARRFGHWLILPSVPSLASMSFVHRPSPTFSSCRSHMQVISSTRPTSMFRCSTATWAAAGKGGREGRGQHVAPPAWLSYIHESYLIGGNKLGNCGNVFCECITELR